MGLSLFCCPLLLPPLLCSESMLCLPCTGVQVASADTDLLELTEENVEKVLDEVSSPGAREQRW